MRILSIVLSLFLISTLAAQQKVNPVIKTTGGIYEIPVATVTPDPTLKYKIVVDVAAGHSSPDSLRQGLYLVSRMMNLFSVGGVPDAQVEVVLAIHGGTTIGVMNNDSYRARFGIDNPSLDLLKELKSVGVRLTVCGQSLVARKIPFEAVAEEVEIATSMLTTIAMYQIQGFKLLAF
jgi:intracellular sulfur oxidation DsrE/DsrF family protein